MSLIPSNARFFNANGVHVARALERTLAWIYSGIPVDPGSIILTDELIAYAQSEGVSEEKLRDFIAASYSQAIRPYHMLGFAKIESHYCSNIGGGVAIDEVWKRYYSAPLGSKAWWLANVAALKVLALQLGVDIRSIPGSIGAGAISCMQIMPVNWVRFGGGDYENVYISVVRAGQYLNATGYKNSFPEAVHRYNPNGGQAYVDMVVAAAAAWEAHFTGSAPDQEPELDKPSFLMTVAIFLEFLNQEMSGDGGDGGGPVPPVDGKLVHPFPTFTGYGYLFGSPVYVGGVWVIDHPGTDFIGPLGDPILASHNGKITWAQYLSRFSWLAVRWWISGNVVINQSYLEDGRQICTFNGHGLDNSYSVQKGDTVTAGEQIMRNGNTGFSSAPHDHFAVKVGGSGPYCDGGSWEDPLKWIGK
ncbi:hypothetical protein A2Z33_00385 [Candidatus Gottesmanbacteria bacterium RBG_16_52_11]|uniref:M23ase beta-sheet core domain-containing protein n=1 Tax=Candidatus Gottesmanbacteria bacterium RBG_16_52_11 TaxID=1798374 RepID=A0A1F5YNE6_9BACT|nr:MAG: hypothetical protein A2Z33_00385 [Candidatus Gottesmanbacteria bacterium RBG_16_52_11]